MDIKEIKPILKEIGPEYSTAGLKLQLQYFGHVIQRPDSLEKTLLLGKIEDQRRRRWQKMRRLDSITDSGHESEQTPEDNERQVSLARCNPWGSKELDMT